MEDREPEDGNNQRGHCQEPVARDWAWLDRVTGPVDADFAAAVKGRGSSVSAETVRFDAERMWVGVSDGRVIGVPLAWFPRLLPAGRE